MKNLDSILMIEDNHSDQILFHEYLQLAGIKAKEILVAESMQQLLTLNLPHSPNIIFLDLNLPDSNGLQTFLTVNKIFNDAPIIILTGASDTDMATQAIQAGAQDYVQKNDLDERYLSKVIEYSIERKKVQTKLEESNKRYEAVSHATNDIIWDYNLLTGDIIWNEKVARFGYHERIKKNGTWWLANIHTEDMGGVKEKLDYAINNGKEHWSDNYRFKCADGRYRHILDRGYIFRDSNKVAYRMIGSMEDVTSQTLIQEEMEQVRLQHETALLAATLEGQENERNFIARELHDNINQMLATIQLLLKLMISSREEYHTDLLKQCLNISEDCAREIRLLSHRLAGPQTEEMEFTESLSELINLLNLTTKSKIETCIDDKLVKQLSQKKMVTIYRIVQEQMNNIVKHANAHTVTITLTPQGNNAVLMIKDDGMGFNVVEKAPGIGLNNMKIRCRLINADCRIESTAGNGCLLEVTIPLNDMTGG